MGWFASAGFADVAWASDTESAVQGMFYKKLAAGVVACRSKLLYLAVSADAATKDARGLFLKSICESIAPGNGHLRGPHLGALTRYPRRVSELLVPRPLTPESYATYGRVLMASPRGEPGAVANLGTALRYDDVVDVENQRKESAALKVKIFRSRPVPLERRPLALLEKHPRSTQLFIPMNASRYIALVALGGDRPDLSTLAAFVASGPQGISYGPGVWHHPMITIDSETDFVVMVHEDGTPDDCVVVERDGADWPLLDLAALG